MSLPCHGTGSRSGLTLIELVVVLALLAGLAAMTLTGVGDLGNRGRYDETATRLRLIREAVVGNGVEPGRFVRDMGRLPMVHDDADGVRLEELWRDAGGIGYGSVTNSLASGAWQWPGWAAFGGQLPGSVELACGWNGPYLMVDDPSTAKSYDGFGNAWRVSGSGAGDVIARVTSLGSDNAVGGTTWDEADQTLDLGALLPETELTVVVKARNSTNAQDVVWRPVEPIDASATAADTPPYRLHKLHVALFVPEVGADAAALRRAILPAVSTDVAGSVTFTGLAPTRCRVFAYGYLGDPPEAASLQTSGLELEPMTLNPGRNMITLHLRKP
ncbi:MAG: prepilin-type N-terminal cleavage/methylation domain-containing protein [Kiritimatiellia bacterium]|jgi:prepilin-type N-terminal cleavage/methylation domain-containing protein